MHKSVATTVAKYILWVVKFLIYSTIIPFSCACFYCKIFVKVINLMGTVKCLVSFRFPIFLKVMIATNCLMELKKIDRHYQEIKFFL